MVSNLPIDDATVARSARRIVTFRLLPFLFLIYIVAYIDRSNVSYASLTMTGELRFSADVLGFGAGVFFFGYFLLDVPVTLLVEKWSARKCVCCIMVAWGTVASLTGLIRTAHEFYLMRFLLGVTEGGFFPGAVVYLTHWFRDADRGKATAIFLLAIPTSQIVCGPISAALLNVHWLGISGWRWLLALEGLPAVVFGFVALFYLTDRPAEANWLPPAEKAWLCDELRRERGSKQRRHKADIVRAICRPDVLLLTVVLFFFQSTNNGLLLWLPKMIQQAFGRDLAATALLTTVIFLFGLPATIFAGWYSDRKRDRASHAAAYCGIAAMALVLSQIPGLNGIAILATLSLAMCGLYCFNANFYLLPATLLSDGPAAASLGFVNAFGHLGGFLGPYVVGYLNTDSGSYHAGTYFLAGCVFTSAVLLLVVRRTSAMGGKSAATSS